MGETKLYGQIREVEINEIPPQYPGRWSELASEVFLRLSGTPNGEALAIPFEDPKTGDAAYVSLKKCFRDRPDSDGRPIEIVRRKIGSGLTLFVYPTAKNKGGRPRKELDS